MLASRRDVLCRLDQKLDGGVTTKTCVSVGCVRCTHVLVVMCEMSVIQS